MALHLHLRRAPPPTLPYAVHPPGAGHLQLPQIHHVVHGHFHVPATADQPYVPYAIAQVHLPYRGRRDCNVSKGQVLGAINAAQALLAQHPANTRVT